MNIDTNQTNGGPESLTNYSGHGKFKLTEETPTFLSRNRKIS